MLKERILKVHQDFLQAQNYYTTGISIHKKYNELLRYSKFDLK